MTITAPETISTTTVEDKEALASLPVGTELVDADGYSFTRNDDAATWSVVSPDGYTYNDWSDWDIEFPAVVQNPEILGEFSRRLTSNDDVKVGDRVRCISEKFDEGRYYLKEGTVTAVEVYIIVDLEGYVSDIYFQADELEFVTEEATAPEPYIFQVGDRVRIASQPDHMVTDWVGITGTVVTSGLDPRITPDTDRPDGYGRDSFYFTGGTFELVTEELVVPQTVHEAALDTLLGDGNQVIRNPFDLDRLPIGTVIRSTDGEYLAVKGVNDTWINPAAKDATNFLWTALAGLGAVTVGVEVLFQPVSA